MNCRFVILFFLCFSLGCKDSSEGIKEIPKPGNLPSVESLKQQKIVIDSLLAHQHQNILVLAKIPSRTSLVEIKNEKWPDTVETAYNILNGTDGKPVFLLESPYSESGDWNITYCHYFDSQGKTFAYTRTTNFFNSGCAEVAYETITEYYSDNFKQILREYKLVDNAGKNLDRNKCEFPYDNPYKVYATRTECLSRVSFSNNH